MSFPIPALALGAWAWVVAHAATIGAALAFWSFAASFANRTFWPRPQASTPAWKRYLHAAIVDFPAFLAARGWAGQLGPFTAPFLSASRKLGASPPSAASIAILAICALGLAGCPPAAQLPTSSQWKAAGIDTAQCAGPSILNAAADAMAALLTFEQQQGNAGTADQWKAEGIALAKQYGPTAAICAAGKAWADLGGSQLLGIASAMQTQIAPATKLGSRDGIGWLVMHQDLWASSPDGGAGK